MEQKPLTLDRIRRLIEEEGASLLAGNRVEPNKIAVAGSTDGQALINDNGITRWGTISSSVVTTPQVTSINTNTTIANTDEIVLVTGSVTVTLPPSPAVGQIHEIKDTAGSASSGNIIVNGNGKNIDGSSTSVIDTNYKSLRLVYGGSSWHLI